MITELKSKGTNKMNIKISKKRANEILLEEIKRFLNENEDVDPKLVEKFVRDILKGEK